MTHKELAEKIGKTMIYDLGKVGFAVTIKDAREVFGRLDFLIAPVSGTGETWVSSSAIREVIG